MPFSAPSNKHRRNGQADRREHRQSAAGRRGGSASRRSSTPATLSSAIAGRLKSGLVRDPSVAVEIETSRPFFVLGKITFPARPLRAQHDGSKKAPSGRRGLPRRVPPRKRSHVARKVPSTPSRLGAPGSAPRSDPTTPIGTFRTLVLIPPPGSPRIGLLQPHQKKASCALIFRCPAVRLVSIYCRRFAAGKFPTRPIKFVVGFLAGGPKTPSPASSANIFNRHLGPPCVVETRWARRHDRRQVGDGFPAGRLHLHFRCAETPLARPSTEPAFNHVRDTTPIAGIMQLVNMMIMPPSLQVKSIAEFIAYGKTTPHKLSLRIVRQTAPQWACQADYFNLMTGPDIVHVLCRRLRRHFLPDLTDQQSSLHSKRRCPASVDVRQGRQAPYAQRGHGEKRKTPALADVPKHQPAGEG